LTIVFGSKELLLYVQFEGILTAVSAVHPMKAYAPIVVTLDGRVMEVNPVQYENANIPILVTLFGMVMEANDVQP
jgi:hypothetical protein